MSNKRYNLLELTREEQTHLMVASYNLSETIEELFDELIRRENNKNFPGSNYAAETLKILSDNYMASKGELSDTQEDE